MANERILIIDDCRINVLLLKHILSKVHVHVDSAGNGETGIELAARNNYPLIFVDIMMPGIDGLETCRRLRAHPFAEPPRVLLLTAMGEEFSPEKVAAVGADGVYFKPIVPSKIVELVKDALARARPPGTV